MARQLVRDYLDRVSDAEGDGQAPITAREKEILRLMAEGFSPKEIAGRLVVSPSTIHSHQSNLMRKLNLSSRHELIRYARQRGLLRDG